MNPVKALGPLASWGSRQSFAGVRVELLTVAGLFVCGIVAAAWGAWLCDDSFISLRYAENLVAGNGLVYNAGEFVEGYTNLLWTLLLAGFAALGADPLEVARYLGLLPYAALALGLIRLSWSRSRDGRHHFVPLAAAYVLLAQDFRVWASGGLETMLFICLSVGGLALTRRPPDSLRHPLAAGCLLALATLTRPDAVLFAGAGAASYWIPLSRVPLKARLRASLAVAAPVALVLAVWIPFKLDYYGDVFPTAFYSKSVVESYFSQGIVYVGLYFLKNWILLLAVGLALLARLLGWGAPQRSDDWENLFWLASAGGFLAYLVWIGGDFMFARRLLPVIPMLLIVLEESLSRVEPEQRRRQASVVFLVATLLTVPLYGPQRPRIRGISDEPLYYPASIIETRREQAELTAKALAGIDVRVAFEGGMCVFGYFSRLPYLVEMSGLTQYSLAKLPLGQRGIPGHEKQPTEAWLQENDIQLVVRQTFPDQIPAPWSLRLDDLVIDQKVHLRIQYYDRELMEQLRGRPGVQFLPIEEVIARSRRRMLSVSRTEAIDIYEKLDAYYFRQAGPKGLRDAEELRAILARKRPDA